MSVVSLLGDQKTHDDFLEKGMNPAVRRSFVRRQRSPTIVKRRYIEQYFFTKLFEVYDINDGHLDERDNALVCQALRQQLPAHDVAIVLAFRSRHVGRRRGAIAVRQCPVFGRQHAVQRRQPRLSHHLEVPGADYFCIAENEVRLDARDRRGDLREMVASAADRLGALPPWSTARQQGLSGLDAEEGFVEVPALAGKVVDRVGAGDGASVNHGSVCGPDLPIEMVGFIGNVVGPRRWRRCGSQRCRACQPGSAHRAPAQVMTGPLGFWRAGASAPGFCVPHPDSVRRIRILCVSSGADAPGPKARRNSLDLPAPWVSLPAGPMRPQPQDPRRRRLP